ncbi:NAD(P)H dehydrogenase subunit NdhS [Prochlorococcus sp. AH-736-E02]|nr:NAD(P)H dehydrogenase subunit NdhS [Prochlorococcus sp. AH-736-E02]
MEFPTKPILPGSFVVVKDNTSIYRGYKGFVQRVTKNKAAVLFEGGNWDKLITFQLSTLEIV